MISRSSIMNIIILCVRIFIKDWYNLNVFSIYRITHMSWKNKWGERNIK